MAYCNKCSFLGDTDKYGRHKTPAGEECPYTASIASMRYESVSPASREILVSTIEMMLQTGLQIDPTDLIKKLEEIAKFEVVIDAIQTAFERGKIYLDGSGYPRATTQVPIVSIKDDPFYKGVESFLKKNQGRKLVFILTNDGGYRATVYRNQTFQPVSNRSVQEMLDLRRDVEEDGSAAIADASLTNEAMILYGKMELLEAAISMQKMHPDSENNRLIQEMLVNLVYLCLPGSHEERCAIIKQLESR